MQTSAFFLSYNWVNIPPKGYNRTQFCLDNRASNIVFINILLSLPQPINLNENLYNKKNFVGK
jgi:hypothetical protein